MTTNKVTINKAITKAFILAAGFGKRLGELTKATPKPLLSINGETFIDRNIRLLREVGITQIFINAYYLGSQIVEHFKDADDVRVVVENELLDTGGGVLNLFAQTDDEVVMVVNSDCYFDSSAGFKLLIDSYRDNMEALLLLKKFTTEKDFALTRDSCIKRTKSNRPYRYIGAHIVNRAMFLGLKVEPFNLTKLWFATAEQDLPYYGCITTDNHFDIGTISEMEALKAHIKSTC